MAFEWWNGSAWVGTETWIPETSTTFSEAFPDGVLSFQIAVEDDTGAKSGYSTVRTITIGTFTGVISQTMPTPIQQATGSHVAPPLSVGNVAQVLPLASTVATGTVDSGTFTGTITVAALPSLSQLAFQDFLDIPSDPVVNSINSPVTRVTRRMRIFEADGTTPWQPEGSGIDPSILGGSVTIDASRAERRTLDLEFYNEDDAYKVSESGFWYDKVVKVYRGIEGGFEQLLGTFYPDRIIQSHFPNSIKIKARDRSKMMSKSKFPQDTLFNNNDPVEDVIQAIAFAAGIPISEQDLPAGMGSLYEDTYFDVGESHWTAAKDIATSFKFDLYFTPGGRLKAKRFADPATGTAQYTFETGINSNIASYDKELSDERIRNHIVITGTNAADIPIYAEAENTNPSSPTRISRIGRRTEVYDFAYIGTTVQAQDLASVYLSIASLEQYQLNLEGIVAPYLDVNTVIGFRDPNPAVGDPDEFLLQSVTIPLDLKPMKATAGRVTLSG